MVDVRSWVGVLADDCRVDVRLRGRGVRLVPVVELQFGYGLGELYPISGGHGFGVSEYGVDHGLTGSYHIAEWRTVAADAVPINVVALDVGGGALLRRSDEILEDFHLHGCPVDLPKRTRERGQSTTPVEVEEKVRLASLDVGEVCTVTLLDEVVERDLGELHAGLAGQSNRLVRSVNRLSVGATHAGERDFILFCQLLTDLRLCPLDIRESDGGRVAVLLR